MEFNIYNFILVCNYIVKENCNLYQFISFSILFMIFLKRIYSTYDYYSPIIYGQYYIGVE